MTPAEKFTFFIFIWFAVKVGVSIGQLTFERGNDDKKHLENFFRFIGRLGMVALSAHVLWGPK